MSTPTYDRWAEDILGAPLPARRWVTNDVTGAVESALSGEREDFQVFTARFGERLNRLAGAIHADDRGALLEKVANIGAGDNWYGPFAELVALDFFAAIRGRPRVEVEAPSPQLDAGSTPVDGRLSGIDGLHFHVKILGDISKRIAESIQQRVSRHHPGVALAFDYPLDLGADEFEAERVTLIDEILRSVASGAPGTQVVQRQTIGLTVRIHPQRPSVSITEHTYHPYRQAESQRFLLLSHAHELLRDDRNLRVHVVHPWYNLRNASAFGGAQGEFFRAISRRLAFELTADPQPLAAVLRRAPDGAAVKDAAQRTSGVLFLVDYSVTGVPGRDPRIPYDPATPIGVLQAFVYVNPNTLSTSNAELALDRLVAQAGPLVAAYDDFSGDR